MLRKGNAKEAATVSTAWDWTMGFCRYYPIAGISGAGLSAPGLKMVNSATTKKPALPITPTGTGPRSRFGLPRVKSVDRLPMPFTAA